MISALQRVTPSLSSQVRGRQSAFDEHERSLCEIRACGFGELSPNDDVMKLGLLLLRTTFVRVRAVRRRPIVATGCPLGVLRNTRSCVTRPTITTCLDSQLLFCFLKYSDLFPENYSVGIVIDLELVRVLPSVAIVGEEGQVALIFCKLSPQLLLAQPPRRQEMSLSTIEDSRAEQAAPDDKKSIA
ncbi:MAG TPA: hypothetical protein VGI45_24175 [Terracidiphilus sp.]|jgi:hypothetical protein